MLELSAKRGGPTKPGGNSNAPHDIMGGKNLRTPCFSTHFLKGGERERVFKPKKHWCPTVVSFDAPQLPSTPLQQFNFHQPLLGWEVDVRAESLPGVASPHHKVVALKFMHKVGRSEKELRSLKREIDIMRDLRHPNIVQLYDSFETQTAVVVVTEYAEGQLYQILEDDGHLPESQVREIACHLVSALYYLHSHRILHRDMKPQNILLGKNGVVKLCDFGFARAMSVSTLVLTSIKGTPLYMSPELVEEKPYDHTADLWSLGCILYELHTGAPPFFANSIFQLVQLILKDSVKWPDSMSPTCMSFLKGLLTKDPQKRLSWPDLLHHPFVADGVLVLPDTTVFNPLTVAPSPDMLALKLQQVADKMVPNFGESQIVRKARALEAANKEKPPGSDTAKEKKNGVGNERNNLAEAAASSTADHFSSDVSTIPRPFLKTDNQHRNPYNKGSMRSKLRGKISMDYQQEFPSVEVGPRLVRRCSEASYALQADDGDYWQKLAQESDPIRQQQQLLNTGAIIPHLKTRMMAFKAQLVGGIVKEKDHQPLKVLHNLILASDDEKLYHIGCELGLPYTLFDLIHDAVESTHYNKHSWSVPVLADMIAVLLIYWERNSDWVKADDSLEGWNRPETFTKPFIAILNQPNLTELAPLAASVLYLFIHHDVDVRVDLNSVASLLKNVLQNEPRFSLPSGWGLSDGLLFLLWHTFPEHENISGSSGLDPELFLDLWKRIGTSLAETQTDFCSAKGLYSFLSVTLSFFTKEPYSCIPLFTDRQSKCAYSLGRLLSTDCPHLFARGSPERRDVDPSPDCLSLLSCHLLCFPFALDLPSHSMSTIIQLYDSCGIVVSLLQVIQTFPAALLEIPLSLLGRLFLCDPEHSIPHLKNNTCGLFVPPGNSHLTATKNKAQLTRTASSLLSDLLQEEDLWESAVELLNVLSHMARCSALLSGFQLHLEATVLHRALAHPYDKIRAATLRLLGYLDPFRPYTLHALTPDIFRSMIDFLHDSCLSVRRTACRAVGNWLGHIATGTGCKAGDEGGWAKDGEQNKHARTQSKAADLTTIAEQGLDKNEVGRWTEEARGTVGILASLLSDPDALMRRHCCAALGNLLNVEGAVTLLLEEDIPNILLKTACSDSHNAAKQTAIATLCLYSQQGTIRQALMSLNATDKLIEASQHAPPHCDYLQLIALL
ncbi:serine/threonine-protein kinase 36 isoform X2 [Cheilinus undulatus]|uniref:serine/threonine-protein kinase 36 isoform X2 n=1 Tax=Cheilinus undulatus TaxID=241271 RepID=UPI001BD66A97|nr:serine/threonine-protein kinase 36 isoform X2 [Cheilinus undulatus]